MIIKAIIVDWSYKMADYTDINQLYINAVEQGNLADAEQFILQGANIDTQDKDGLIALITASKRGHLDIVRLILEHNVCDAERAAKINVAMWYAISGGFIDIIKIFLQNGADINHIVDDTCTPLMVATMNGRYNVVKFMLENGADAGYVNKDGASATIVAKAAGRADIAELLESYKTKQQNQSEKQSSSQEQNRSGRRIEL